MGCDSSVTIGIIPDINRLIGDSGFQFAVCDNLGMPNWVVALTWEENSLRQRPGLVLPHADSENQRV